jgi:cysteine desulfurase
MGALTHGNARVTFGRDTSSEEVEALCHMLPGVVAELRARTAG